MGSEQIVDGVPFWLLVGLRWWAAGLVTIAAFAVFYARSHWGHKYINKVLLYEGIVLACIAIPRWIVVFNLFMDTPLGAAIRQGAVTSLLVGFSYIGWVLVVFSGRLFHKDMMNRHQEVEDRVVKIFSTIDESIAEHTVVDLSSLVDKDLDDR